MDATNLLDDAFERIRELVHGFADLDRAALQRQPITGSNSIGWLLWHTTRVQDAHVAELINDDQLWATGAFAAALGRKADPSDTGYDHSAAESAGVRISDIAPLLEYYDAVADRTDGYLSKLAPEDLDEVIDDSYDPPVTVGARLVSVISDSLQHLGQGAYARGQIDA